MRERGQGVGLGQPSLGGLGLARDRLDQLNGHGAVELGIVGPVHHAYAPRRESLEQQVAGQSRRLAPTTEQRLLEASQAHGCGEKAEKRKHEL